MPCPPAPSPKLWGRVEARRQLQAGPSRAGRQKPKSWAPGYSEIMNSAMEMLSCAVWRGNHWVPSHTETSLGFSGTQWEHFSLLQAIVSSALCCGTVTDLQCSQRDLEHRVYVIFALNLKRIYYYMQSCFFWMSWDFSGFNVFRVENGSWLIQEWDF